MFKKITDKREFGILILFLALCLIVTLVAPRFLTPENLSNIIFSNVPLAIIAFGMLLAIITGGIDVSVAPQMIFSSIVVATAIKEGYIHSPWTAALLGAFTGALTGAINGSFIAFMRIPPIIVTLGTMNIFRGAILQITNAQWIMNLPQWFLDPMRDKALGLPLPVYYVFFACLVMWLMLRYTNFGRQVYACGGNEEAARRNGVNLPRVMFFVYVLIGVCCGLAGMLNASRAGNVQVYGSVGLEMQIIAAVIMGGANILGGSGTSWGVLLGVLTMGVIDNAMVLAHIPTYWQKAVIGALIIITITANILQRLRQELRISRVDVEL